MIFVQGIHLSVHYCNSEKVFEKYSRAKGMLHDKLQTCQQAQPLFDAIYSGCNELEAWVEEGNKVFDSHQAVSSRKDVLQYLDNHQVSSFISKYSTKFGST